MSNQLTCHECLPKYFCPAWTNPWDLTMKSASQRPLHDQLHKSSKLFCEFVFGRFFLQWFQRQGVCKCNIVSFDHLSRLWPWLAHHWQGSNLDQTSPIWKIRPNVWKFQGFSVIHILREINLGGSRSSKIAVFANLGALDFAHLVNISLQKVQKGIKIKLLSLYWCGKKANIEALNYPSLISRKIWMTGKSWNFHTVNLMNFLVKSPWT